MQLRSKKRFSTFPIPFPGETVYGLLLRHHERSGNVSLKQSYDNVLNNWRGDALSNQLCGVHASLVLALPEDHPLNNLEALLLQHTTLPFYLYFDQARIRCLPAIIDQVKSGKALWHVIGRGSRGISRTLSAPQFCLDCVRADRRQFGIGYWHREHQLPWVLVCPFHGTPLLKAYTTHGNRNSGLLPGKLLDSGARVVEVGDPRFIATHNALLRWLSQQVAYLVAQPLSPHVCNLSALFHGKAISAGHTRGKLVLRRHVSAALFEHYSDQFCEWLGAKASTTRQRCWYQEMLHPSSQRMIDPLKAILLTGLYFENVEELDALLTRTPAPQLARAVANVLSEPVNAERAGLEKTLRECDYRLGLAAQSLGLSRAKLCSAIIAAGIRCEIRKAPNAEFDANAIRCILSALKKGATRREVMERFDCSSSLLDEVAIYDPTLRHHLQTRRVTNKRATHRGVLLRYLSEYPHASRSEIRRALPTPIEWLSYNDRNWLDSALPNWRRPIYRPRPRRRIDWAALDKKLAVKVQAAAKELLTHEPAVRVTCLTLLKHIKSQSRWEALRDRLPLTRKAIALLEESKPHFHRRRLAAAMAQMAKKGQYLTLVGLRKASGLLEKSIRAQASFIETEATRQGLAFSPNASKWIRPREVKTHAT